MFELRRLWSSSSSSASTASSVTMNQQQQEELLSLVALHQQQEQQEDEHEEHHRQLQTTNSSSSGNSSGTAQQQKNTIDLMDLTDFDVQLALTENLGVQIFEVTDIVTRWMNDAFRICLVNQLSVGENEGSTTGSVVVDGNATAPGIDDYADFDTIILLERNYNNNNNGNGNSRRRLQQSDNEDGDGVNNDEDENADADGNEEEPDEETTTTSTTTTNRRGEDGEEESEAQGDETTTVDAKDAETVPTTADTYVGELYTAAFKGAALFVRQADDLSVPDTTVLLCQRQAFLEDAVLLSRLQQSTALGLGLSVIDVRAFVNPINSLNGDNNNNNNNDSAQDTGDSASQYGSSTDDSLEVVIIVAIVIACVAFLFLIFAIFWAWRYDKRNRQAYLAHNNSIAASSQNKHGRSKTSKNGLNDTTFDAQDSPDSKDHYPAAHHHHSSYPSVIGGDSVFEGGVYPESVISEDIESSLSQYYNSSAAYATHRTNNMHGGTAASNSHVIGSGRLHDAASVSSMESYGYSLDGYAPSLATTPMPSDAIITARVVSQQSQPSSYYHTSSMYAASKAPLPTEPAKTESESDEAAPAASALNLSDFTDAMMTLESTPAQTRGHDVDVDDDDDQPDDEVSASAMMDNGNDVGDCDDDNYDVSLDNNDLSAVNTTLNSCGEQDVRTTTTTARDLDDDIEKDDNESK